MKKLNFKKLLITGGTGSFGQTFLFKAILANDYDEMEELGIYELLEEDIALCEFVDVSKNELQKLLRRGLNLLMED